MDWVLSLIVAIGGGLIYMSWAQTRRHKKQAAAEVGVRCALWGYKREGLAPDASCPECGQAPNAALKLAMRKSVFPVWGSWCGGIVVLAVIAALGNGQRDGPSGLLEMGMVGMIPAIPGVIWARLKRMRLIPAAR